MPHWSLGWCAIAALWLPLAASADESLYARIGGERLVGVVDEYVNRLSTDARTRRAFEGSDLKRVKRMLAEQLCDLAGGPCEYSGDSMREVHAGHGIDDREFLSGVELLRDVLKERSVPLRERNELLALLAPMKRDVVDSK
jgi:hemoglobin